MIFSHPVCGHWLMPPREIQALCCLKGVGLSLFSCRKPSRLVLRSDALSNFLLFPGQILSAAFSQIQTDTHYRQHHGTVPQRIVSTATEIPNAKIVCHYE